MLQTDDNLWIQRLGGVPGTVIVSSDVRMISDHDIARLAASVGAVIFLIKPEISQQKRWELMAWYFKHLPRLAVAASKVQRGTAWIINKEAQLAAVA